MKREKRAKDRKTKNRKSRKSSLLALLLLLSVMPLILAVGIISGLSAVSMKKNLEEEVKDSLCIVASNLAQYCQDNEITAINASNYYEYLDSLKEKHIEMAILIEGAPCATSIKNENDYRIREIPMTDETAAQGSMTEGFYDKNVDIDGKIYYAYYMPIRSDGEVIGMAFAAEQMEFVSAMTQETVRYFVVAAFVLVVVFAGIAVIASRRLTQAFTGIGTCVNALSEGNLQKQGSLNSSVKEMHALLDATEYLQTNLSQIIGEVKEIAYKLTQSVSSVTEMSKSTSERAGQISVAMDELASSTMSMASHVEDIHVRMMEIGDCVNEISNSVEHLYSHTNSVVHANDQAKERMDIIMENSRKSVEAVSHIAAQVHETNDSIAEVDKAVGLILSISEQTNLLSLNASIEAARAGEFGKGFSVVATEIRSLSEQSAQGAEMIKQLADTIIQKSQKSVEIAGGVRSLILEEQENIAMMQSQYEELSESIYRSADEIKAISDKTVYLTGAKEKVIGNVQDLSAISEENAAGCQEVNANISEIISEVETVNENCEQVSNMASQLTQSVSFFTV